VESEPGDFWTAGRRIRIGRAVAPPAAASSVPLPDEPGLRLADLPAPYDALDGTGPDDRACWLARARLGLPDDSFGPASLRPPADEPIDL
jgi:hypothetical protein